jgi:hypothetical protein
MKNEFLYGNYNRQDKKVFELIEKTRREEGKSFSFPFPLTLVQWCLKGREFQLGSIADVYDDCNLYEKIEKFKRNR